jgi:hypothetical protein
MTSEGQSAGSPDMQAQTVGGEAVSGGQGRNQGVKRLAMDPSTGSVLEPRSTAGGNFLYRFHFQLHGMDRATGVDCRLARLLMLIAIVTGCRTSQHLQGFLYIPSSRKALVAGWDNCYGVLSLPFNIVFTFSGCCCWHAIDAWAADAATG